MFSIISPNRYSLLLGRKVDHLYHFSPYEWHGTLQNGEYYILVECKGILVQIDLQKEAMLLGTARKTVLGITPYSKPNVFNIYKCCDFFEWDYDDKKIGD
jgi:hypothetical protein